MDTRDNYIHSNDNFPRDSPRKYNSRDKVAFV